MSYSLGLLTLSKKNMFDYFSQEKKTQYSYYSINVGMFVPGDLARVMLFCLFTR